MEATVSYSKEDFTRVELRKFIEEGLQDAYDGNVQDFDATFDELEKRYSANG